MSPELGSRVNLAIRQWNKQAREKGGAVTLKKTNARINAIRNMEKALPQLDWSEKDSWKRYYTAVFELKPEFEKRHPSKDFRVTLDWALSKKNILLVVRSFAAR